MKACSVIINGNTVTTDDVKEYILSGDTQKLNELLGTEDLPILMRKILTRFAVRNMEDSVMELQAKRTAKAAGVDIGEYPSKDVVNEWIYPKGQFSDYNTQREIHRNTYSGMRLTGISANSGKEIAYTLEGTPVTSVIDSKGNVYEGDTMRALVNSFRYDTVAELLRKRPEYRVHSREEALLKDSVHISMDGHKYDRLSRVELDSKGKPAVNPISGDVISVFETIDSIINLAIDNVKEQKLFVYGITNSNANAFFAALSLGIPLNSLVRMFTSPIMRSMSANNRIFPEMVYKRTNDIIDDITTNTSIEELYETAEKFLDPAQYKNLLTQFKWSVSDKEALTEKLCKYIANNGSLNSDTLDKIYVGEASQMEQHLSDLITLKHLNKLLSLGEEMFANAQTLSLLRKMPSSMSRIDYLSDKPREYANFSYVASLDDVDIEEYIKNAKEYIKSNDPKYTEEYLKEFEKQIRSVNSSKVIESELAAELESKFRNAMAYATIRKEIKPSDKSSFVNMSIMNIPHVYSAWRTLNLLKNIAERSFALHNQLIKTYMLKALEDANLFTSYNKYEMTEQLTLEFMKALSSSRSLSVNGDVVDLNVTKETLQRGDTTLYGVEAWSQSFINRVLEAKREDITGNRFLENLEIDDRTGLSQMGIYSDKIEDFKIKEGIRQDFLALYKDENTKQLALDTLKYSILSEGLLYSRATIALIFPPAFIAAYSRAFEDSIASIVNTNKRLALSRLDNVYNIFLHQFLRNFPDTASYVENYKPLSTGSVAKGDYSTTMYSGINRNSVPFTFDLHYPGLNSKYAKKFIKRYGDEIYVKIDYPDPDNTYYRQITEKSAHKYYEILPQDFEQKFDVHWLADTKLIVPSSYIKGKRLLDPNTNNTYLAGDIVYSFNRASVRPAALVAYKVVKGNPSAGYELEPYGGATRPLFSPTDNSVFTSYPILVGSNALATINSTHGRVRTLSRSKTDPNGFAIVQGTDESPTSLGINEKTTVQDIQRLDPTKTYYVQSKILDALPNRKEIAEALYKQIGYVDRNIDDVIKYEEDSITLSYKLKSLSRNRPHLTSGNTASAAFSLEELTNSLTTGYIETSYKDQTVFKKLNEGDVVYLGLKGSIAMFGYVEEIKTIDGKPSSVKISLIPPTLAVSMLADNYSKESYALLLQEHNKC